MYYYYYVVVVLATRRLALLRSYVGPSSYVLVASRVGILRNERRATRPGGYQPTASSSSQLPSGPVQFSNSTDSFGPFTKYLSNERCGGRHRDISAARGARGDSRSDGRPFDISLPKHTASIVAPA